MRSRIRFESLDSETTRDGSCNVTVRLEWDGEMFRATAAGLKTRQGMLKAATQAALAATLSTTDNGIHLDLVGVKAVRAFDGWVVIARLSGDSPDSLRLLGAAPCETQQELPQAAVHAVFDATNRVISHPPRIGDRARSAAPPHLRSPQQRPRVPHHSLGRPVAVGLRIRRGGLFRAAHATPANEPRRPQAERSEVLAKRAN